MKPNKWQVREMMSELFNFNLKTMLWMKLL
ncbi:hypothetical protein IMSAGC016_01259 [Muribaculaceae bacterium]|nr:hypothetical protein IMSAGC016_01259 [Muribaculaceae bacterium]